METLIKKFVEDVRALSPGNRKEFLKNLSSAGQQLQVTFQTERRQLTKDAMDFADSKADEFAAFAKK